MARTKKGISGPSRNDAGLARAEALAGCGDLSGAESVLREMLKAGQGGAAEKYLLSSVLILQRRYAEAEPLLDALCQQTPNNPDVLNSLGVIALELHQDWTRAEQLFAQVVRAQRDNILALGNLGNAYFKQSRFDKAEDVYKEVLAIDEGNVNALNNLGALAKRQADFNAALNWYRKAYAQSPKDPNVLRNLLITNYYSVGDDAESIRLMREILALPSPGVALLAVYPLAKLYCMWDVEDRICDDVISLTLRGQADALGMEMTLLNAMANPEIAMSVQFQMHKVLAQKLRDQMQGTPYATYQPAGSKLRIGYFSGDFRAHSVHKFLREIIGRYDRTQFEVYCYSTVNPLAYDEVTREYQRAVDAFVDVSALSVQEVAKRIHADGINVLVNLTGYTGGARMGLTCYRPAPVQISYLGYPYTSGMGEMDFMISDKFLDTAANHELFTEDFLVLPRVFVSHEYLDVPGRMAEGPQKRNGFVTFGSLNNPYKFNRQVVAAWAAILQRVPSARLVLNNPKLKTPENRENITAEFVRAGIAPERISYIWERHPSGSHLQFYNDIDVALDTFPLTGGTTTVDSVLMGVPVVTLVGEVYYQRLSYAILSGCNIDVTELAANTLDEYVDKAVQLATSPERLTALRQRLLENTPTSPLCDTVGFARTMEEAYRAAWQTKQRPVLRQPQEISITLAFFRDLSQHGFRMSFTDELSSFKALVTGRDEGFVQADLWVCGAGQAHEGRPRWRYVPAINAFVGSPQNSDGQEGAIEVGVNPSSESQLITGGWRLTGLAATEVELNAEHAVWSASLGRVPGPFAPSLVAAWAATMQTHPEWEVYSAALNCYVGATEGELAPVQRVAQLERSNELLLLLAQNAPTPARLASLLQVSMQLGLWGQAAVVADYLGEFLGTHAYVPDEPMLPPLEWSAALGPAQLHDALAETVQATKYWLALLQGSESTYRTG